MRKMYSSRTIIVIDVEEWRMKKLIIFLIVILLVVVFLITIFFWGNINNPYTEIINLNWSIELPNSYKEIYSIDSGASFHGDGERYHIFEYDNKKDVNISLNWKNNKNAAIESAIENVLNNLNVSQVNRPNLEVEYKYYSKTEDDSSKIYLIFVPNTKKLYVIEDIY